MKSLGAITLIYVSFVFCGVLTGCATPPTGPKYHQSLLPESELGQVRLIVFRDYAEPLGLKSYILVDKKKLFSLSGQSFGYADISVGEHTLQLKWPAGSSFGWQEKLNFKANETYYFQVHGSLFHDKLINRSEDMATAALMSCCRLVDELEHNVIGFQAPVTDIKHPPTVSEGRFIRKDDTPSNTHIYDESYCIDGYYYDGKRCPFYASEETLVQSEYKYTISIKQGNVKWNGFHLDDYSVEDGGYAGVAIKWVDRGYSNNFSAMRRIEIGKSRVRGTSEDFGVTEHYTADIQVITYDFGTEITSKKGVMFSLGLGVGLLTVDETIVEEYSSGFTDTTDDSITLPAVLLFTGLGYEKGSFSVGIDYKIVTDYLEVIGGFFAHQRSNFFLGYSF